MHASSALAIFYASAASVCRATTVFSAAFLIRLERNAIASLGDVDAVGLLTT